MSKEMYLKSIAESMQKIVDLIREQNVSLETITELFEEIDDSEEEE